MERLLIFKCTTKRAFPLPRRPGIVDRILDSVPAIPFDLAMARVHSSLWADLSQRGTMVAAHDLKVAAIALHLGHSVVTFNDRDFHRVPGLRVVRP